MGATALSEIEIFQFPDTGAGVRTLDEAERRALGRILARVQRHDGHWLWPGTTNPQGYAKTTIKGRREALHRWVYERLAGLIPDDLQIDHLCRVRNCINPDHLEVVTGAENRRRARQALGVYDACIKGHPRVDFVESAGRTVICRACKREGRRAREARGVGPATVHGTASTYSNLGCRCTECRYARRMYDQARRACRAAVAPHADHPGFRSEWLIEENTDG